MRTPPVPNHIVAGFPSLSDSDFDHACLQISELSESTFLKTSSNSPSILRFTKLVITRNEPDYHDDDEVVVEEPDDAALVRRPSHSSSWKERVVYDVVLSPTYRVPVVYIYGAGVAQAGNIHDLLVPDYHRTAVKGTGIMGALTMTDHPVTGLPAYFIHPCRTADALRESRGAADGGVTPVEYMMLWFGIIGASVGLYLPAEVAFCADGARGSDLSA